MARLKTNPWGLTPREEQLMDMLILWGSQKAACRELDIALKTGEAHILRVKRRMSITNRSVFQHLIMWDRFRREKGHPEVALQRAA